MQYTSITPSPWAIALIPFRYLKSSRDGFIIFAVLIIALISIMGGAHVETRLLQEASSTYFQWITVGVILTVLIGVGLRYHLKSGLVLNGQHYHFQHSLGFTTQKLSFDRCDIKNILVQQDLVSQLLGLSHIQLVMASASDQKIQILYCSKKTVNDIYTLILDKPFEPQSRYNFDWRHGVKAALIKPLGGLLMPAATVFLAITSIIPIAFKYFVTEEQLDFGLSSITLPSQIHDDLHSQLAVFLYPDLFAIAIVFFFVSFLLCAYIAKWLYYFPRHCFSYFTLGEDAIQVKQGLIKPQSFTINYSDIKSVEYIKTAKANRLGGTLVRVYVNDQSFNDISLPFMRLDDVSFLLDKVYQIKPTSQNLMDNRYRGLIERVGLVLGLSLIVPLLFAVVLLFLPLEIAEAWSLLDLFIIWLCAMFPGYLSLRYKHHIEEGEGFIYSTPSSLVPVSKVTHRTNLVKEKVHTFCRLRVTLLYTHNHKMILLGLKPHNG